MYRVLLVFSLFAICWSEEQELQGKLIFAHVVFRHGDRTPVDPYPTDPYKELKSWPTGWGQLTTTGMMQHYKLGQWIHNRYSSIINDSYTKDAIYIQSTDVDRTLMSAQSHLAGFFPPKDNQIWNSNISWQPIPIHTIPESADSIVAAKKKCPSYDYNLKKVRRSEEFHKINKRFKPLYQYLSEHTGRDVNSIEGAQKIYDILFIEELYNKTLPDWTKKVYPGDMKWLASRSFATATYTRQLARLKSGPLLKDILERFQTKASKKLHPDRAMWIYSAHDTTIANLLNTLKLFEYHSPPYTACILLELRILNESPYISIFYKNTTEEPRPLNIPDCGILCPLSDMFRLYNDVLPDNWDSECTLSMLSMTYEEVEVSSAMAIVACGALIMLIIVLIFAGITYYRRRNYFDYRWYVQIDG